MPDPAIFPAEKAKSEQLLKDVLSLHEDIHAAAEMGIAGFLNMPQNQSPVTLTAPKNWPHAMAIPLLLLVPFLLAKAPLSTP